MGKKGIKYYYDHLEETLLVVALVLMTILVFLQVVLRYVFNSGIMWSEEVSRYMFVWISWLGLSLGEREKQHIKVEMVVNKLKGKPLLAVKILSALIILAINLFMVYQGIRLLNFTLMTHKKSALLHCTMAVFQAAIPVGCALMAVRNVEELVDMVKPRKKDSAGGPGNRTLGDGAERGKA